MRVFPPSGALTLSLGFAVPGTQFATVFYNQIQSLSPTHSDSEARLFAHNVAVLNYLPGT